MDKEFLLIYSVGTATTVVTGIIGIALSLKKGIRVSKIFRFIIFFMSFYFLVAQLLKSYANKNYVDMAVWNEMFYNLRRGMGPWSSLQEGLIPGTGHWFSAHFTPLIYILAIPFWFFRKPEVIIISQYILLSTSVFAVFLYAKHWLKSTEQAFVIASVFVLYPTFQYINLYEFEMLRFCIPLLFFSFYFLEVENSGGYWITFLLSLLVREEVAITTFLLGIYTIVFIKEKRRVGVITASVSLIYFLVVTQIVMPSFHSGGSTEHVAASWFAALGKSPMEMLIGIFTKPHVVFNLVSDPIKLANLFMYGLPLLFIPLLGWQALCIGLGNIGLNMLSGSMSHTTYFLYYLSPAIPFIFIGLVKGVAAFGKNLDKWKILNKTGDGVSAVLFGLFSAALVANLFFGPSPLSLQFWIKNYRTAPFRTLNFHYSQYYVSQHARLLEDVLTGIPKNVTVSAEQHILPRLYDRKGLKVFPDISGVDYVVIDKLRKEKTGIGTVPGSWDGLRENPQFYYDWVEKDSEHWKLITSRDGYYVYAKMNPVN